MPQSITIIFVIVSVLAVAMAIYVLYKAPIGTLGAGTQNVNELDQFLSTNGEYGSIYYRVTDRNGVISSIHDSGINPSKIVTSDYMTIPIIIREITDEKEKIIGFPKKIELGKKFINLEHVINVKDVDVQNLGSHYLVKIKNIWKNA
jgi:hypothetical protein